jgi:uncharacterized protein YxjI
MQLETPSPQSSQSSLAVVSHFERYQRFTVRQKKKWLEILTSFEARNSYDVFDEKGVASLQVREQGSGFLAFVKRVFLGPMRPFEVLVSEVGGRVLLKLRRPFRFFFHRLEVSDADGRPLGAIQREWSFLRRIYTIEGAGQPAQLFGPILKPWTFELRVGERVVGVIQKRWSGLAKEMFTDADNFGADLSQVSDPALKALACAAIVLIDIVHFERSK